MCRDGGIPVALCLRRSTEGRTVHTGCIHTADYLKRIGVPDIAPATSAFDPGYDPSTLAGHLQQSAHLMSTLKISMACWIVANESATRTKIALARAHGVPTVTGGGPFEIAVAQGELPAYLDPVSYTHLTLPTSDLV